MLASVLAVQPVPASAGPDLGPDFGPAFTPEVTRRFVPRGGGRIFVTLAESKNGALAHIDWEVGWFAADKYADVVGWTRGRLPLTIPSSCKSVAIRVDHGTQKYAGGVFSSKQTVLTPKLRTEIIPPESRRERPDHFWPGSRRPLPYRTCNANVEIVQQEDKWRLTVVSMNQEEWGHVGFSVRKAPHPAAYPLYPLAVLGDGVLIGLEIVGVVVVAAVAVVVLPFFAIADAISTGE